ncbi:flagellar hook-basal body complex protein FliE [Phenylobacterium sp.]|jgi:flagellar hook-basal body complex protein FliE|uniref:flagellar hook-basal body complex protein FliE n=1 Tax=Phenylobacterium sp. TaxID=1871053 RepID=UPI002E335098|nr:flagellar hook-basal body complex protein FliE [Phenylobacterium sp.]HEX4710967.1 flagellar hook-basal body complex protein FliE [Phenylobacterium sp.]
MITALAATKAYATAQKAMGIDPGLGGSEVAPSGGGFADILKSAMTDALKASKNAETQMANQVQGKAQLVDVATAVTSAQSSLETVLAIRDQVISAYQEIMRMPI